ncbi:hypothetical protein Pmani_017444 [Petrolisthes manimaculis]|uniref:Hemicentin-1-like n=1 Tax=Petrolisthes manimaculis TaxID=1843537 RepID=A0AAE1U9V2_9EUCA|nr:hypothetical protein Pmani_017444 [Petrolisthes manimaculis]
MARHCNSSSTIISVLLNIPSTSHANLQFYTITPASVLWTRAGSVVGVSGRGNVDVGGDGRTLRVVRAGTHNAGDYTCTATNQAGVIDIPVTLNVLVPPVIARKKGGVMGGVGVGEEVVRVREGGHAALECHLMKGSPTPSRHWDAPHHPHHPPHHTVVGGGERLVIAGAGVGDSGAYSCRANNSAGEDVKVVWVEVMAPPRINTTALPGNPTVLIPGGAEFGGRGDSQVSTTLTTTPGTTVILPCPVTGSPPPRRLWYRGTEALVSTSRQVVGAGGRDLTLVGISGRDAGAYVCLAVNPAGEAQLTTALIIIGRPKIEGDSEEEVTVVEGGRAELECRVKRPPSTLGTRTSTVSPHRYNITWTKSGQELLRHPQSVPILSKQTLQGSRWEEEDFPTLSDSPTVHDVTHSENRTSLENRYEDINSFDNYSNVYDYTYEYPVSALTPPDQREGEQRRNNTGWYSISRDRTRLTLPRVTRTEEGLYSCEVTNQAGSTRRIFRVDALVSPVIEEVETARRRLAAAVGDPVVLECDARGDPIPQVIWYHGPNQVDSSARLQLIERNQVLLITSVEEGDGGNYTCLATNLVGVTEQNFQLEVMVPPETLGLREVLISEGSGQRVELECQARGHPIPDITWTYRGELLSESDNIIIDNNLLTIQQAGVEVAGEYQCEAVNSVGSAVKRFHVEVTEAPVIAGGREEVVTVVEGENVTLHCLATGHPDPLVSWLKDSIGVRLSERVDVSWGGQSLMLMDARKEDTARYTCLATNIAGNHTKHYDLQVLQSPQLVEGVDEIVAVAGEVVTLRCSFTGYPQPQISWYFEGSPVGLGEGEDRTMLPSSALQLSPTRPTHSGNYTCQADNEAGQNSHNIALTVMTPPTVKVGSARVVVVSGDEVTLRCRGIGTPAPTLRWLKGHQVITEGPEFEVLPDGSLHLPVATIALADTYVCSGRSVVGADHDHTELVVHELPSVQPVSTEVLAVVGQEVKLTCKVTGHPSPTLTWTRPDQGLKPVTPLDPRIQVLDEDLVLSGVKETDGGSYQCTAHNSAGHTSAHLHLTVHSPPTLAEERLETVVVRRGEELQLTCTASGFPLPRVTWLRDGEVLGDSPGRSLTPAGSLIIPVTKAADSGVYTCQVTNPAGRLYREVEVVVQVPPRLTLLPRTAEVTQSERFVLECEAVGVPVPSISWLLNGVEVEGVGVTPGGRGVLVVERAAKRDEGTYTCLAENEAGHRKGVAAIRVKVPPVIRTGPGETTVLELTAVTLTCLAEGDPAPATTWTKGGHFIHSSDRVQLMDNGSLVINASQASDAGEYKCVVSNDAGAAEATAQLVVHTPPVITHPPVTTVVEVGRSVMFDCVAEGSPTPNIQWNVSPGELHARYLKLTNGSLQLIAAQVVDEGQVICQAYNELGEDLAKANLDIRVSGAWGLWGPWSPCSVSCGTGQQQRRRQCDSPAPRHGGSSCPGDVSQPRPCRPDPCPVDGKWSPWQSWSECSTTCGTGVRVRVRVCAAPAPVYGGKECDGDGIVEEECHPKDCPVSGGWGEWGEWSECSRSCGEGLRQRSRLCDSPAPAGGGQECDDDPLQLNPCSNPPCLIDGKWSAWAGWSVCSVSCGGGVRQKRRVCDNPIPSNGGRYCPGSDSLEDYCNLDMCPINGGWSLWSEWGGCTASCGGGQRRRFRTCDSPAPSPDGRACPGPDTHTQACNNHTCPVAGLWGSWSEWSSCSMTCGIGFRVRTRRCDSPAPRSGGDPCLGDHSQTATCEGIGCEELPEVARGTLMGELNGEDLGIVSLAANLSTRSHQRTLNSAFNPIIPKHGTWLVPLLPVLSPGQWTAAYERDGAANGHTLTRGFFRREAHVAFATGETVDVTQVVRGVDSTGALLVDIVVTGDVPYLPPASAITLQPYTEDYVQTGGGSLFASSTRTFGLGHHLLPYAWNHTISYDPELGNMPHLVETLHATNLDSSYSTTRRELQYSAGTNMAPAQYSDICPSGFTLDPTGPYCQDNNECLDLTSRCSHGCINTQGGYSCTCTPGYMLGSDGYTCQDVDECSMIGVCGPREQCQNTPGSYSCSYTCGPGLRTTPSGTSCEDINECEEVPDVCDQTCLNLIGGYRCDCRRGFRLIGQSRCVDIDECSQLMSPCSHSCHNTIGSFRCQCPDGYSLLPNGRCKDINECALYLHDCVEGQDCENTPGSYSCTTHCPPGLKHATNVSCTDIDECAEEVSMCHYTQLCTNTWGSYRCSCSRGFTSPGPGHPCLDINECLASPPPCQHRCHNLRGSYECICPPGQQRLPDGKSCVGLQYVEDPQARLPPSSRRPRPALPGLPTSEFQERLLRKFYVKSSCPAGFEYINGECQDLNECRLPDRCQHHCHNTYGSYMCLCPPGYRVNPNLRTCDDVNECSEQHVECGVDELCFNLRGSYKCVSAPCPAHYQRDATTGSCILDCRRGGTGCPPGVHYAHILAFKTASLPAGIQANQDLVRLMAYDQSGHLVPHTLFTIIENQTGIQFRIRLENGKGIMRTLQPLTAGQEYRMVVEAVSYDQQEHTIRYSTRFIIFLHISEYPY